MTLAPPPPAKTTEASIVRREPPKVQDESQFANMLDTNRFEHMQRLSKLFSESTMIPEHYRGNIGNCFIALQMSVRLGVDPFMFMQKSYIVHGKPGIEAQLAIALINTSGLFEDALDFEINGDDPDDAFDASYRVRAWAVRASTGKRVNGPWIDWKLVNAEQWFDKPGSKWKTMPEQMFMYRAASFFGRLHCPERLMGMQTAEELQDVSPGKPGFVEANVVAGKGADAVRAALEAEGTAPTSKPKTGKEGAAASRGTEPMDTPAANAASSAGGEANAQPDQQAPADVAPAGNGDDPRSPEEQAKEYADNLPLNDLAGTLKAAAVGDTNVKARYAAAKAAANVDGAVSEFTDVQVRAVAYHYRLLSLKRTTATEAAASSLLPKTGGRPRR